MRERGRSERLGPNGGTLPGEGAGAGRGFRWFVHREAAELGLRGWVRNTERGTSRCWPRASETSWQSCGRRWQRARAEAAWMQWCEHELDESEGAELGPFEIEGAW